MLTYSDEITVEEYNDLRRSVNWITVKDKRAQKALTNSFYKLIARKDGKPVGMARIVSDGGYTYFITDVIVRPECRESISARSLLISFWSTSRGMLWMMRRLWSA